MPASESTRTITLAIFSVVTPPWPWCRGPHRRSMRMSVIFMAVSRGGSVEQFLVDDVDDRQAALVPADVLLQHARGAVGLQRRPRRDVRHDEEVRQRPERAFARQRLLLEDVERRPRKGTGPE